MLLGRACNGIVMLVDTHGVHHGVISRLDSLHVTGRCALLQCLQGVKLVGGVQVGLALSDLALGCGTRSEVPSPVVVGLISIGEHVICLDRVAQVLLFDCIQVDAWRRPHKGGIGILQVVEVLDKAVKRHKVHIRVSEGEITALRHEKVVTLVQV